MIEMMTENETGEFDTSTIKTILMLGRPGSGKGTQSKQLSKVTGFEIFSSGGRFRQLAKQNTFVASKIEKVISNGLLMPPWFASYVFQKEIIEAPHNKGYIFEGSARTLHEAEHFHSVMTWLERPYKAVHLTVDQEVVISRLLEREDNRSDDSEEAIRIRFAEYERHTAPAIEFIKSTGHLIEIDGTQSPEAVHTEVLKTLALN